MNHLGVNSPDAGKVVARFSAPHRDEFCRGTTGQAMCGVAAAWICSFQFHDGPGHLQPERPVRRALCQAHTELFCQRHDLPVPTRTQEPTHNAPADMGDDALPF